MELHPAGIAEVHEWEYVDYLVAPWMLLMAVMPE